VKQKPWLLFGVGFGLLAIAAAAHAQSASAIFNGPQNMDPGLQNGLNNLTGYVPILPSYTNILKANAFRLSDGCQRCRRPHPQAPLGPRTLADRGGGTYRRALRNPRPVGARRESTWAEIPIGDPAFLGQRSVIDMSLRRESSRDRARLETEDLP
jgi:hypothetical protein